MKAIILNSGMGSRMGELTSRHPKCMTEISCGETILSRQLKQLADAGIKEVIITIGAFADALVSYCHDIGIPISITFVKNPSYQETNYIYSIYCAREYVNDDIVLIHGDLVFENSVLDAVMEKPESCMVVSTTQPIPKKDFKAVVRRERITAIGVEFFKEAVAAQPLYKLLKKDWKVWLDQIVAFCEANKQNCYAENAFNEVSNSCRLYPLDVRDMLCSEIDTPEDLAIVSSKLHTNSYIFAK